MKLRSLNSKLIFEEFILKDLISKLKNKKVKFKKKFQIFKSLIENLYKAFLKIINHAQWKHLALRNIK